MKLKFSETNLIFPSQLCEIGGRIEYVESLMVDWGFKSWKSETKGQIRKSHEAKVEIEFLMGFNCMKSSLNPIGCN